LIALITAMLILAPRVQVCAETRGPILAGWP